MNRQTYSPFLRNCRATFSKTINSIVVFVAPTIFEPQRVVVPPPKTDKDLTCHHKIARHEGRRDECRRAQFGRAYGGQRSNLLRRKNMSGTKTSSAEKEAEAAVNEFLEMRAAILGRLSPEALRCVAGIFERRMKAAKEN
jgi:hypothetical protein